jgi:hypothetical protein
MLGTALSGARGTPLLRSPDKRIYFYVHESERLPVKVYVEEYSVLVRDTVDVNQLILKFNKKFPESGIQWKESIENQGFTGNTRPFFVSTPFDIVFYAEKKLLRRHKTLYGFLKRSYEIRRVLNYYGLAVEDAEWFVRPVGAEQKNMIAVTGRGKNAAVLQVLPEARDVDVMVYADRDGQ